MFARDCKTRQFKVDGFSSQQASSRSIGKSNIHALAFATEDIGSPNLPESPVSENGKPGEEKRLTIARLLEGMRVARTELG